MMIFGQSDKSYYDIMDSSLSTPDPLTAYCEVCKTVRLRVLFQATDRNRVVDDRIFSVMQCQDCGVGHTVPKLSTIERSRYYPREYYSLDENIHMERNRGDRRRRQVQLDRICKYVSSGRLLDIGTGTGMFIKTAREQGFLAEGLEMSKEAADFGRKTWNLTIQEGDLYTTRFPENSYDVVTLGHVFEHLEDPESAARMLYTMVRPGGLLVIAVPNFNSIQAKIFRNRWFHLDIPRHLFHYSPWNLKLIFEKAGFVIVEINYFSSHHNWAGILGSMMRLSPQRESFAHKIIRKIVATPLSRIIAYVEALVHRGGTFELYAIKK